MSILTKVLIVLLLLLSVVYLGVTSVLFAYRVDYKRMLEKEIQVHKDDNAKNKVEIDKLRGSNEKITQDRDDRQIEINGVKRDLEEAERNNKQLANDRNALIDTQKTFDAQLLKLSSEIDKYRDDIEKLNERLADMKRKREQAEAAREQALQESTTVKADCEKLTYDLNTLFVEHNNKLRDLEEVQQQLSYLQSVVKDMPQITAPIKPDLQGKVLAVTNPLNILTISLGQAHDVKVGYDFIVSRGPNFIAEVKVYRVVDANHSACEIKLSQAPIEIGDTVSIKK